MENRPSSNSSSTTTLFDDKFTDLEKLPDPSQEPRRRWVSIMIMAMLGLLLLATGGGLIVSGLVFGHRVTVDGQCASQSFVLFACLLAIPYLGLHLQAARMNFVIIRSQPFQHPLHSWTVIMARLDFVAWAVALIASSVTLAKAKEEKVHIQLDVAVCVLAFLAITVCFCVVEKASEPFVLPWISPSRMFVCRISAFGSQFDDSISRRASRRSPTIPTPTRSPKKPTPAGPRPFPESPSSEASEPVSRQPEDDLLMTSTSKPDHVRAHSEPGLKMPEPTYQPQSSSQGHQYIPYLPHQSRDWSDEWSVFAGEAGLRRSGSSTVITGTTSDFTTTTTASTVQTAPTAPSAPYSVWTPVKKSHPRASHSRSYSYTTNSSSGSKRPLLPTLTEIMTPLTDASIDDYLGPWSPSPTEGKSEQGTPVGLGIGFGRTSSTSTRGSFKRRPVGARSMPALRTPKPIAKGKRVSDGKGETKKGNTEEMKVPGSFVE